MRPDRYDQLCNEDRAISPIVATLMLVLVAAGAAVGFGAFMSDWQGGVEESIAPASTTERSLRIAGSSTVYEFSKIAVPEFEARNPGVKVELEKGGSAAGRQAVSTQCDAIDVGASSSPFKSTELAAWPDCNGDGKKDPGRELVIVKVATDGVVLATLGTNTHCAGVPVLTQKQGYSLYYHNVDNFGTRKAGAASPVAASDLDAVANGGDADGNVQWNEVPDSNGGKCTGTQVVEILDRSDAGGTSEIATQKLFGGTQSQLEDFVGTLNAAHQGDGNQGVLDAANKLANKNDAMWFTSFGYATTQGLDIAQFGNVNAPIAPALANIKDGTYEASRPILYVAVGMGPQVSDIVDPLAREWLNFVTLPDNNQLFAQAADFVPIY